jgi:DNA-binding IclR family transcriptional regulator
MTEQMDDGANPGASGATGENLGANGRGVAAVQSVDRALMVMEILAKLGAAGVTEIAAELGVHKSTVSRLIAVLESRGYVEQLSDRGKYRLGFSVVRLAGSTSAPMDLTKQGQGTCDALATQTGETTNLAILDGDRIINVVEAIGTAGVALRTWVGQSCPAHATSSGKVLLSELTAAELRSRLGEKLTSFTPNTIVELGGLEAELATARANGWAAVNEELEIGLNAVSAPVRDSAGGIVAALSVSGPSYRLEPAGFGAVAQLTIDAAGQISRRLGYTG